MKVAILCGGVGTRLAEETKSRPKPMVEVGPEPILWHIMKYYSHFGYNDFALALGYMGDYIKQYFVDRMAISPDMQVDFSTGKIHHRKAQNLDWKTDLVDTGDSTLTGGRIKRLKPYLNNETFMMTWGDGLCNVDLNKLLAFHRSHGKLVTLTAVRPPARFGQLEIDGNVITSFSEKPQTTEGRINGAFFVCEPEALDYIEGDDTQWEREPLEALARDGQLMAYNHDGFWQCMDTLRDKVYLNSIWDQGTPPWKVW